MSTTIRGAWAPALPPQFPDAKGVPAANCRLCTTATGTNIPLAVFSDPELTQPLPNPIQLNAAGQPQTAGGTSCAIFLQPKVYRFTLWAAAPPNVGNNVCNGVPVGALI